MPATRPAFGTQESRIVAVCLCVVKTLQHRLMEHLTPEVTTQVALMNDEDRILVGRIAGRLGAALFALLREEVEG